ncbi:MAG TPA: glycosyltransferase family 4 protein [Vicinamibacterales bacterium]|nr:glycosyltransferase family 4 protein [Vicinamibacterales bacterium]
MMRILIANDGFGDAGGVQQYLDACVGALVARGHTVALVHRDPIGLPARVSDAIAALPQISVAAAGFDAAMTAAAGWAPDVCYSHNMNVLAVDRGLAALAPVVKFMHGYFGTCVSGLKRHAFPSDVPCDRVFGPACAALFLPRRCGRLSPSALVAQYRWTVEQRALFTSYRAIVVASEHMRREFVRNGADAASVHANPLFPTCAPVRQAAATRATPTVAFMARMTSLKGGDLLVRAAARASRTLGSPIALTMIGDGPARAEWEALARSLGVACRFTGWLDDERRFDAVRDADLLAMPSVWPEPFGLSGLEAAALGVPAIAFDVGGVGEWLRDGVNGILVAGDPPRAPALGDALADALSDRARLVAMRPRALAVAREMSLDRHVDRLEALLDRCASGGRPPIAERVAR